MTIWVPDLARHDGPRYQAIAAAIAQAVEGGTLNPGDRLPPQRDLAYRLGVTVGTVSRGYMLAEQQGLVAGEVGRGTYVREPVRGASAPLVPPVEDGPVDLSINMATGRVQAEALGRALETIAAAPGLENLLRYMPPAGHPEHRAAAARWVGRVGLEVGPENLFLTQGAQQGLALVFEALAAPGDTVLAEALTYPGIIENAHLKRVRLKGVALDREGMIPEALDEAARASGAKVVVLVPTVQNPTAAVMGEDRRRAIAEVAARHELIIVEDDVYGYLLPERPAPIATIAPERTVYITSASKCLAPGLRVGWIVARQHLLARFTDTVYAHSVAQPALTHEILRRWIDDGTAVRLTDDLRDETQARQLLAAEVFDGFEVRTDPFSFHLLIDLPRPWRRDAFVAAALDQGVRVASLASFALEPETAPEAVRISLSAAPDRDTLRRSLGTLRDLALAGPRASRAVI